MTASPPACTALQRHSAFPEPRRWDKAGETAPQQDTEHVLVGNKGAGSAGKGSCLGRGELGLYARYLGNLEALKPVGCYRQAPSLQPGVKINVGINQGKRQKQEKSFLLW